MKLAWGSPLEVRVVLCKSSSTCRWWPGWWASSQKFTPFTRMAYINPW